MSLQTPPPVDDVFDLLADAERRTVLDVVRERGAMGERPLARRVVARRRDVQPEAVAEERVERLHQTLWHVHLPKLDETTLVDHDRSARRVAPGTTLDSVVPLLTFAAEYGRTKPDD
jgi:hypothetical protein